MIFGSVNFTGSVSSILSSDSQTLGGDINFYPVYHKGFSGGYYLHSRLPYIPSDCYFFDENRDIVVLLSGTIYNKPELTRSNNLASAMQDPELIASLFLRDGPGFARYLNGDFAFILLQPEKKEFYLFRDHLGIVPMAWINEGQGLHFTNDIMGLCQALKCFETLDSEFLLGYFKYIDYRRTPNKRVKKLPPGHYLHFSVSANEVRNYWEPKKIRIDNKMPYERMLTDLRDIVFDAVKIRCDRRFNAGAHISGGLDSTLVATLARQEFHQQKNFFGFSWSPAGNYSNNGRNDEREFVTKSCSQAGIIPLFSEMSEIDYNKYVSGYFYNQGYFSEDETTDKASLRGINLIFSGFGGDEFISTGHSGVDMDLLRAMKLRKFFQRNPLNNPRKFIRHFLFYVLNPALGILDHGTRKGFNRDTKYIKQPYKESDRQAISYFYYHRSRHQMHLNVLGFYNIPERCESWNRLGFRKGIEHRYPLLDRRIVEYMLKVPSELLCRSGHFRPLLREIGKGIIPEEVRLNQSKSDLVLWEYLKDLNRRSSVALMDEVVVWQTNSDLHFVDFDLLARDITLFKSHGNIAHEDVLFRSLVYFKALHEFTMSYRTHL